MSMLVCKNVRLNSSSCVSFVSSFFYFSLNFFICTYFSQHVCTMSLSSYVLTFHNMSAPCLFMLGIIVYFYINVSCYKIFILTPLTVLLYALGPSVVYFLWFLLIAGSRAFLLQALPFQFAEQSAEYCNGKEHLSIF